MTRLQRVALGVVVLGTGTGAAFLWRLDGHQRQQEVDLRLSIAALRAQDKALSESAAPRQNSGDGTPALRGGDLQAAQRNLELRRQRSASTPDVLHRNLRAGLLPITAARNQGTASPQASIETSLWAIHEANVDQLMRGIELTPEAAAEAGKLIEPLPADLQAQYRDPKRLVATLIIYAYTVAGYHIGDPTPQPDTPSVWMFPTAVQLDDGRSVDPIIPMHQTDAGWMIVLDLKTVSAFASILTSRHRM